jgi:hypothetical protein
MLFQAAAQTLLEIAADPKHLGARVGCLMVLHTWGQNLMHQAFDRGDSEEAATLAEEYLVLAVRLPTNI